MTLTAQAAMGLQRDLGEAMARIHDAFCRPGILPPGSRAEIEHSEADFWFEALKRVQLDKAGTRHQATQLRRLVVRLLAVRREYTNRMPNGEEEDRVRAKVCTSVHEALSASMTSARTVLLAFE